MKLLRYLKNAWHSNTAIHRFHKKSKLAIVFFITVLASPFDRISLAQPSDPVLQYILSSSLDSYSSSDDHLEVKVWLIDMSARLATFISDSELRTEILKNIYYEASKVNLQPELVLALIQTESAFDPYAVSSAGAQGLMQIMPFWKDVIGRDHDNLISIKTNLRYGCTILSYYLEKENGNLSRALARYNGSLGKTWYPDKVLTNWERYWQLNYISSL